MKKNRLILVIILLITKSYVFGQYHLDFIPKNNKKTLSFKVGEKIGYAEKGRTFIKTGELHKINDSTITVSGKTIPIADLKLIGHRKKGMTLIGIGSLAIAGFALGYFILPANNSTAEKVVGLSISIPMFTLYEIISWKNRVYNVSKNYTYKASF